MREGLLVQKKEEEEYKKLSDLAQGGRDASEFLSWQQDMRRMDLENKLAEIEANRISGLLSYEEAILARQSLVDENRKNCLLYTSPSPRDATLSRMPSSA